MLPEGDKVPLGTEDGHQRDIAQLSQFGRRRRHIHVDKDTSSMNEDPIITPHEKEQKRTQ